MVHFRYAAILMLSIVLTEAQESELHIVQVEREGDEVRAVVRPPSSEAWNYNVQRSTDLSADSWVEEAEVSSTDTEDDLVRIVFAAGEEAASYFRIMAVPGSGGGPVSVVIRK